MKQPEHVAVPVSWYCDLLRQLVLAEGQSPITLSRGTVTAIYSHLEGYAKQLGERTIGAAKADLYAAPENDFARYLERELEQLENQAAARNWPDPL